MPVVIALLNSYSGLAAAATGFVLENTALIISGSLVGASGIILTNLMCKAMNRSLLNVLFGGFGEVSSAEGEDIYEGKVKATSPEEVALLLEGARRVVVVPGYGMAVAQAQYAVRDLYNLLESRGVEVEFGIHPVAGRMPGHMNVLLAEVDIPYEKMKELEEINPSFEQTDVVIVIGANDVVNPLAQKDPKSPIAGMPPDALCRCQEGCSGNSQRPQGILIEGSQGRERYSRSASATSGRTSCSILRSPPVAFSMQMARGREAYSLRLRISETWDTETLSFFASLYLVSILTNSISLIPKSQVCNPDDCRISEFPIC